MNWLAPENPEQKTLTVPVSIVYDRKVVDGVWDRDIIAVQTRAAMAMVEVENPDRLVVHPLRLPAQTSKTAARPRNSSASHRKSRSDVSERLNALGILCRAKRQADLQPFGQDSRLAFTLALAALGNNRASSLLLSFAQGLTAMPQKPDGLTPERPNSILASDKISY